MWTKIIINFFLVFSAYVLAIMLAISILTMWFKFKSDINNRAKRVLKGFVFFMICGFGICIQTVFAQESPGKDHPAQKPPSTQRTALEAAPPITEGTEAQESGPAVSQREPFRITREFEAQMEEVEPPEIEVTGIVQAKGKTVAIAKLQLDKVEGRVALQPGMRVSIPKPDRESSESDRWMTYFTVQEITAIGMVIILENGEKVWYPVMGSLD